MLNEQHRMAPQICSLVSDVTYDGNLKNAKSIMTRLNPFTEILPGLQSDLVFYNHGHLEEKVYSLKLHVKCC